MFRFLTDRYPLIMQRLDEDHVFDHFYLDMNGIIHQCTHPSDDEIAITDYDAMFARIFNYTERLYRIVAPTKLMFLAVDGVAPRAKMNQQRSRRFRSAKDAERAMGELIARGDEVPDGTPFDSNCITPGTQFMYDLSIRFREWIHEKMTTDPAFQQGCSIVFSGPEVPGEGEHKIMDYIRTWKGSDAYSPAIRHCMYGLDADLMMLGLVAHSPHFTLIREKMKFNRGGRKVPEMRGTNSDADEFQLLEIPMLRDMLFLEFKRDGSDDPFARGRSPPKTTHAERKAIIQDIGNKAIPNREESKEEIKEPGFKYDSKRIVDDFVFMCMLVGNDFIPNLPHLDIADGAINIMFRTYRHMLPGWGGYLTDRHRLHPDRLESFLEKVSLTEAEYFTNRAFTDGVEEYRGPLYRQAYYQRKFNFDVEGENGEEKLSRLRRIYMEGLHWVLQYYHNGVSSWNWFYPDFYAVLASDMKNLRATQVKFQRGRPFRPLTQLMAVLPPESAEFLPTPMRDLMTKPDSPVVDFYPLEFTTDQNGKRNPWEAVVVVPFIDEKRLLSVVNAIDKQTELTEMERLRDNLGTENWFHASDYPRSMQMIPPVRPSKFAMPRRGRRDSSTRYGRSSNSSSPQGTRRSRQPIRRNDSSGSDTGQSNGSGSGDDSEGRAEGFTRRSNGTADGRRRGGRGGRRRGGMSTRGRAADPTSETPSETKE